jgi:hypothetical protein
MKAVLKSLGILIGGAAATSLAMGTSLALRALAREHPAVRPGTVHTSLSRDSCAECHAPIAAEWRESFHFRSVTGPFWERVRTKGFATLFRALRIPCMNCHAPANVLDLPPGGHPVERSDDVALGIDCVSCHVSQRGILGPGRSTDAPHEVIEDERFRDGLLGSTAVCARCHEEAGKHARTVTDWQRTPFARDGVTCLHCHMPEIEAPSVAGGPARRRRSHRFPGDKSEEMLRRALNSSILMDDGRAIVRITNDRVGHSLPASGMNWLLVKVTARDETGRRLEEAEGAFGTREWVPGYLDFWPFLHVTKIPHGESRDIVVELPPVHGHVVAEFRYRDWFAVKDRDVVFARVTKPY